jgi:hypothetical protein
MEIFSPVSRLLDGNAFCIILPYSHCKLYLSTNAFKFINNYCDMISLYLLSYVEWVSSDPTFIMFYATLVLWMNFMKHLTLQASDYGFRHVMLCTYGVFVDW